MQLIIFYYIHLHLADIYIYTFYLFQEQEEQRRRQQLEKDALERWKEEERRQYQQEIRELRQLFIQQSKDMASKSSSTEAVSIYKLSYYHN